MGKRRRPSVTKAGCSLPSQGRLQRCPVRGWPSPSGCPAHCAPPSGVPAEEDKAQRHCCGLTWHGNQPGLGRPEAAWPGEQHSWCSWEYFSLLPPPCSPFWGRGGTGLANPCTWHVAACCLLPACPAPEDGTGSPQHHTTSPAPSAPALPESWGNSGGPADPPLHSPVPSLSPCQSSPSQDGWPRTRSPCLGALQPCTSSPCSGQPGRGTTMPAQFGAWVGRSGGHLPATKWLCRWEMGLGPGVKHWHNPPERLSPRCYWSRSPCLRLGEPGRGWVAWGRWVPPWAPLSTGMVHSRASPAPQLAPHLAGTVRVHGGLWHPEAQPNGAQFGGDVDDRGPAAAQPLLPHALRCLLQEWQKFLKQRHQRSVNT